ncbi:MAG: hypothetical protein ABJD97_02000, partial [Betaproteobacteria bacterium]
MDARAGMAFVSRAGAGGDHEDVVYFRPPGFQPEPIGRSSLALGATRAGFQAGLVIEGREADFPSLAAAGEFVRRAYVRSSSGDGGGEPEPGGEPPGPLPEGPKSGEPVESGPALDALIADMAHFRTSIDDCRVGEARPMKWKSSSESSGKAFAGDILVSGTAHCLRDTLAHW